MVNGNKVTKKNWHKVVAISSTPCTNVLGVKAIDDIKNAGGEYFEKWKLVFEEADDHTQAGYIFREINHGGGISGRHESFKRTIWGAIGLTRVYLEE